MFEAPLPTFCGDPFNLTTLDPDDGLQTRPMELHFAPMFTRRRLIVILILLALFLLAAGYLALTFLRQVRGPAGRRFFTWWQGNEATRAALVTVQREACPGAPFILPADGFIGLLYAGPARPLFGKQPAPGHRHLRNSEPGVARLRRRRRLRHPRAKLGQQPHPAIARRSVATGPADLALLHAYGQPRREASSPPPSRRARPSCLWAGRCSAIRATTTATARVPSGPPAFLNCAGRRLGSLHQRAGVRQHARPRLIWGMEVHYERAEIKL